MSVRLKYQQGEITSLILFNPARSKNGLNSSIKYPVRKIMPLRFTTKERKRKHTVLWSNPDKRKFCRKLFNYVKVHCWICSRGQNMHKNCGWCPFKPNRWSHKEKISTLWEAHLKISIFRDFPFVLCHVCLPHREVNITHQKAWGGGGGEGSGSQAGTAPP